MVSSTACNFCLPGLIDCHRRAIAIAGFAISSITNFHLHKMPRGTDTTYTDEHGNAPEEPPGGWYKTTLDTPHGRHLIDLIERGIISEVSKS